MLPTVLMVAEKPILAESIAKILSKGKVQSRKGFNDASSVHEYFGVFLGKPARFKVTSTCGHIYDQDFPPEYKTSDAIELFFCPTEKKEANPELKMDKYLSSEAKGCDYLVLWLNCNKKGENICFEVIDCVKNSMNRGASMDFVYRAHFSALADKEIKNAMENLIKPNLNESLSVDARQEIDLRVGCAFTRFQTRYFQDKCGDLDSTCISFGPCQTPVLAFCVKRHDQIIEFTPEPYWILQTTIATPAGKAIKLDWSRDKINDRDIANLFLSRVSGCSTVKLASITSKNILKEKPTALNTAELLRVCSSSLGLAPQTTMSVAEQLYDQGYISYPLTETTAYPISFDFNFVLNNLKSGEFSDVAQKIMKDGISKPLAGEYKDDHPPITPMKANSGHLSGDELRVYDYVTRHFLATLMKPCTYMISTFKFTANTEIFTLQSRKVFDPGFTIVITWQQEYEDKSFSKFKSGTEYNILNIELVERKTSPLDYLTESELITSMERYGIGTDASISEHISSISAKNYVSVESGRRLVPTKLGIALIHGYRKIDPELILPTMRAEIEKLLNLIVAGKQKPSNVTSHAIKIFQQKFENFVKNISKMDTLFEAILKKNEAEPASEVQEGDNCEESEGDKLPDDFESMKFTSPKAAKEPTSNGEQQSKNIMQEQTEKKSNKKNRSQEAKPAAEVQECDNRVERESDKLSDDFKSMKLISPNTAKEPTTNGEPQKSKKVVKTTQKKSNEKDRLKAAKVPTSNGEQQSSNKTVEQSEKKSNKSDRLKTAQEPTSNEEQQKSKKVVKTTQKKSNKNNLEDVEITLFSAEEQKRSREMLAEKRKMEATGIIQKPEQEDFPSSFKTNKGNEYKVVKELGKGISAKVYEVMDSSKNSYALKLCESPYPIFNDCQVVKLANSINSPYFGEIYEAGNIGKKYYLIFKLLGPTLAKAIEKASITSKYVAALQTLQALNDLNNKLKFLHNDVKGNNFCVGLPGTADAGKIFLLDFGICETINERQEGAEENDEIATRKYDLVNWLEMVARWFNIELESMFSKEYQESNYKKNYQTMAQISPGFQTIFLFIENMKHDQVDYNSWINILKLELRKLTEGRPFRLDWCPDTIYKEPPASTASDSDPRYKPPFYMKNTWNNLKLIYYGAPFGHPRPVGIFTSFRCRGNGDKCKCRIEVGKFDEAKVGDAAIIHRVVNFHTCDRRNKQFPACDFDYSIFFD